jgi:hypothetical protein
MVGATITAIWPLPATAAISARAPNLTGIDPITGEIVPLFDPRRDRWPDHFRFRGPVIEGVTAVGRTTIKVLSMNDTRRIDRRELLARRSDSSGDF